jgi:hypothetical protein
VKSATDLLMTYLKFTNPHIKEASSDHSRPPRHSYILIPIQ